MKTVLRSCFVLLGSLLPWLAGCTGGETETLSTEPEPGIEPQTSGSSSGTNGLLSDYYQTYEALLHKATSLPLVTGANGLTELTNPYVQQMIATAEGYIVFTYAVTCALRANAVVTSGGQTFVGGGHLRTTQGWYSAPLSTDARHDLQACMVAHVNVLNIHVPLMLSGEAVLEDGTDHSTYKVQEALWVVEDDGSKRVYNVWPLPTFEATCLTDPWNALKHRVCGQNAAACSLVPRKDRASACKTTSNGGVACDGQRALETTLTTEGYDAIYVPWTLCPPI
jgi:hypothetical protein